MRGRLQLQVGIRGDVTVTARSRQTCRFGRTIADQIPHQRLVIGDGGIDDDQLRRRRPALHECGIGCERNPLRGFGVRGTARDLGEQLWREPVILLSDSNRDGCVGLIDVCGTRCCRFVQVRPGTIVWQCRIDRHNGRHGGRNATGIRCGGLQCLGHILINELPIVTLDRVLDRNRGCAQPCRQHRSLGIEWRFQGRQRLGGGRRGRNHALDRQQEALFHGFEQCLSPFRRLQFAGGPKRLGDRTRQGCKRCGQ